MTTTLPPIALTRRQWLMLPFEQKECVGGARYAISKEGQKYFVAFVPASQSILVPKEEA